MPAISLTKKQFWTSNRGGGLAIAIIRKGIWFSGVSPMVNTVDSLETLTVSIDFSVGELLIVTIYRVPSPGDELPDRAWTAFHNSIFSANSNSIFFR